jgi:hypothetical protein
VIVSTNTAPNICRGWYGLGEGTTLYCVSRTKRKSIRKKRDDGGEQVHEGGADGFDISYQAGKL